MERYHTIFFVFVEIFFQDHMIPSVLEKTGSSISYATYGASICGQDRKFV